MAQEAKNFDSPDETRKFVEHGQVKLVKLATGPVGLGTFEPGWRWSNDVKPLQGTESCQVHHIGYVVSGRMKVVGDDGQRSRSARAMCSTCSRGTTRGRSGTKRASWSISAA